MGRRRDRSSRPFIPPPDPAAGIWWIDAAGGFIVFHQPKVGVGRLGASSDVHLKVMGDLSNHHADFERTPDGWVLKAHGNVKVNNKPVDEKTVLHDGDQIAFKSVKWTYHQPLEWSPTARLTPASHHRLPMAGDAVVLMGDLCVMGPRSDAHIAAPWSHDVFVSWYRGQYWVRTQGDLVIDGQDQSQQGSIGPTSEVEGPWGSFRCERLTA